MRTYWFETWWRCFLWDTQRRHFYWVLSFSCCWELNHESSASHCLLLAFTAGASLSYIPFCISVTKAKKGSRTEPKWKPLQGDVTWNILRRESCGFIVAFLDANVNCFETGKFHLLLSGFCDLPSTSTAALSNSTSNLCWRQGGGWLSCTLLLHPNQAVGETWFLSPQLMTVSDLAEAGLSVVGKAHGWSGWRSQV